MRCLLSVIIFLAVFAVTHELPAQNPLQSWQKKIDDAMPKGRLLKRLRDDLRGEDDEKTKAEKAAEKEKARLEKAQREMAEREQAQREKAQKQASRFGAQPNLAQRDRPNASEFSGSADRASLPALGSNPERAPSRDPRSIAVRETLGDTPEFGRESTAVFRDPVSGASVSRDSATPQTAVAGSPTGFGLMLIVEGQRVVVADVDRQGNAFAAGIRKGDLIEKIGGLEIQTIEEFDQIAGMLKGGDQVEMVFSRRGKSDSAEVAFGTLEGGIESPEGERVSSATAPRSQSATAADLFAPPLQNLPSNSSVSGADRGMQSVLDNQIQSSLTPRSPISGTDGDIQSLQQTIQQQQQQINALQKQLDAMRERSSRNSGIDPPLGG
jgi:Skp family chaperone for outer membrane proteins